MAINLTEKTYTFARPNDTTAYTAGDLVANSTTAGSVVPLSWAFPSNAPLQIAAARMIVNTSVVANATFRLHILNTIPTFVTGGDNSTTATVVATNYSFYMLDLEGTLRLQTVDGAAGLLVPGAGITLPPIRKAPTATVTTTLYGILEARAAYVPAALASISVTLIMQKDV